MWIIQTLEGKVCCFDLQNLDDDDGFMVFSIFKKKCTGLFGHILFRMCFFVGKRSWGAVLG